MSKFLDEYKLESSAFTTTHPDDIEEELVKYLKAKKNNYRIDEDNYNILFQCGSPLTNDPDNIKNTIQMQILEVTDTVRCIEFLNLSGDLFSFNELVKLWLYDKKGLLFTFNNYVMVDKKK